MSTLRTQRFPDEFEGLLSAKGRRVLRGKDARAAGALARGPFYTADDLIHARWVHDGAELLHRAFEDLLREMTNFLPSPFASTDSGGEKLPKVGRMLTTPTTGEAITRAREIGLLQLLSSESYQAFVAVLAGRRMLGPRTMQVLSYRAGDYAGPHTDNHPTEPEVARGYVDVHFGFCTRGVTRQLLVYEKERQLTEVVSLHASGVVTAYRLPFWHYTTPLEVKHPTARRWLVLGTFVDG